ncbi:hypothetical protein ACTFIW_001315 [Dictyostelium discoideum]
MSKAKTISSLVLLLIAFGFATAAFSLSWYGIGDLDFGSSGYMDLYNGRIMAYVAYSDEDKIMFKNMLSVIHACVAFDIFAWVLYLVGIVFLIAQLSGRFNDSPSLKMAGKFVLVPAMGCILLSVFILLAIPGARKKDCIRVRGEEFCEKKEFGFWEIKEGATNGTPSYSWIFVNISALFSIAPMILNLCGAF